MQETVKSAELDGVGHGISPVPERFRVSRLRVHMTVDSVTVALVDDRYGNHIEVLAIAAQVLGAVDCFVSPMFQVIGCFVMSVAIGTAH